MIGIQLQGRLGNQMFQYAFIYSKAVSLNRSYFYTDELYSDKLFYFELKYGRFERRINNIKKKLFFLIRPKPEIVLQEGWEDAGQYLSEKRNNIFYKGFFQSDLYFKQQQEKISRLFRIRKKYQRSFQAKYAGLLNSKFAVIQVRLSDYKNFGDEKLGGKNVALPFSYYEKFINSIDRKKNKILFISDDMEEVRKHFGEQENFFYESNDEITDFQLMLHADALCISNSSFGWWAAYLNKKAANSIYVPKYWLGFKVAKEFPANIVCKGWHEIDVLN